MVHWLLAACTPHEVPFADTCDMLETPEKEKSALAILGKPGKGNNITQQSLIYMNHTIPAKGAGVLSV